MAEPRNHTTDKHMTTGGRYTTGDILSFSVHPETGDISLHGLGHMPPVRILARDWFGFRRTVEEEHEAIAERHGG